LWEQFSRPAGIISDFAAFVNSALQASFLFCMCVSKSCLALWMDVPGPDLSPSDRGDATRISCPVPADLIICCQWREIIIFICSPAKW
jgi:hypothetical protein